MPVGYLLEDIHAEPLAKFCHPFLVTGRTEMAALAGKRQQVLMAAVFINGSGTNSGLA